MSLEIDVYATVLRFAHAVFCRNQGLGFAFGGDGDFLHQFADHLTLLEVNDRAFRVEPLTSHKTGNLRGAAGARQPAQRRSDEPALGERNHVGA